MSKDFNLEWSIPKLDRRKELAEAYHIGLTHGKGGFKKLGQYAFDEKDFFTAYCEGWDKSKARPGIQILPTMTKAPEPEQVLIPGTEELMKPKPRR